MNTLPPSRLTLPEVPVTPLTPSKLEAMIAHALTHPQQTAATVVPFAFRLSPFAYTSGVTAMAASVLLAITFMPLPGESATDTTLTVQDDLPSYLIYSTLSS